MHLSSSTPSPRSTSNSAPGANRSRRPRTIPAQAPQAITQAPAQSVSPERSELLDRGKAFGLDMGSMCRAPLDRLRAMVAEKRAELEAMLHRRYADFEATLEIARGVGVDEPSFERLEDLAECSDEEIREEAHAALVEQLACFRRAKDAGYVPPTLR